MHGQFPMKTVTIICTSYWHAVLFLLNRKYSLFHNYNYPHYNYADRKCQWQWFATERTKSRHRISDRNIIIFETSNFMQCLIQNTRWELQTPDQPQLILNKCTNENQFFVFVAESRQNAVEGVRAHVYYPFINNKTVITATVVWKNLSNKAPITHYRLRVITLYDMAMNGNKVSEFALHYMTSSPFRNVSTMSVLRVHL